ncbi:MAG TPA: hypothetical protein ENH82_05195 [bacterium]|nr:hypothetical protein [bacterium]
MLGDNFLEKEHLLHFNSPLIHGTLIRRYKRFISEVELRDRHRVMAHCPNTGSMKGVLIPGGDVLLSRSTNHRRKLPYTLGIGPCTWDMGRGECSDSQQCRRRGNT